MLFSGRRRQSAQTDDPNRYAAGTPVSYWLMPDSADMPRLKRNIEVLANELNAPVFEPHVTLYSTQIADGEDPAAHLAALGTKVGPLHLACGPTGHSGLLFKTLYIDLSYQALAPLATALRDCCKHFSSYRLEPHLSLLYRALPAATREAIAQSMKFQGQTIRFSSLAAVIPGPGETDFSNVGSWQMCAREDLTGDLEIRAQPGNAYHPA